MAQMSTVDDYWLAELHAQDERLRVAHESIGGLRWERDHMHRLLAALVKAVEPAVDFDWSGNVPRFAAKPETVKHAVQTALWEATTALGIMAQLHPADEAAEASHSDTNPADASAGPADDPIGADTT